jgi:hypothetical protein
LSRKKSFDLFNDTVQEILNNSKSFRELVHIAISIGMRNEDLAQVAAIMVVMGWHRGEREEQVAEGIANGLEGALQLYTQIMADDETIH